jgi:hypothetical protein
MGNSYAKEPRVNRLKPQDFAIDLDTFFGGEIPTDMSSIDEDIDMFQDVRSPRNPFR